MKKSLIFIIILCNAGISLSSQDPAKSFVRMGASQINITPEKPTVMGGYGNRINPFTGVHDELFASALYFSEGRNSVILITTDLLSFTFAYVDELKKAISEKAGIPSENIMITAVHNHGGPGTRKYETDIQNTVEPYLKMLKEKLVNLALDASKNTKPVKMGFGKSTCNMNINRRAVFADGTTGLGRNPDGPCDHDIVTVKFEDLQGNLVAALVNWPCHGTASGPLNYQITGDWPGAAARYIKKQAGKDLVVAITAGASGDINPIYGPGSDFREIEAVGFHAGKAAWESIENAETFPLKSIQSINTTLVFPGKLADKDEFPHSGYSPGPDTEIRLTLIKLGNLVISGVSGELMNEIGVQIKKQSPYSETIVVTHCNGSSGYICTDKSFPEGGYEVSVTKLMPGAEKPLISKYVELISSF